MIAIRQFVQSLTLGLGLGLCLVALALYLIEPRAALPVDSTGVSAPTTQPDLRRDEAGVPLQGSEPLQSQDLSAG